MNTMRLALKDGRKIRVRRAKSIFTNRNSKEDCMISVSHDEGWGVAYDDEPGTRFTIAVWLAAETGEEVRQSDRRILDEIGIDNLKDWGFINE